MNKIVALLLAAGIALAISPPAAAQKPVTAAQVLPAETIFMVSTPNVQELVAKFQETWFGQLLQDEQMRPLVGQLQLAIGEELATAEDNAGFSFSQLAQLPQGEVTFAVVTPADKPPTVVLWLDGGEKKDELVELLEQAEAIMAERGLQRSTIGHGVFEIVTLQSADRPNRRVSYARKGGQLFASNDADVLKSLLDRWMDLQGEAPPAPRAAGEEALDPQSLAEVESYRTIMQRCRGTKDEPAQLVWFFDPIKLIANVARNDANVATVAFLLPSLGLDGLQGLGGSVILATEDFDSILHLHVALANPRTGVLEAIAFGEADTKPENWVPGDAASYTTLDWAFEETWVVAKNVTDKIWAENVLPRLLETRVSREIGIDVEKEFIPQLQGRVSFFTLFERPARIGSQMTVAGMKLKDREAFEPIYDKLLERFADNLEEAEFGEFKYQLVKLPPPRRFGEDADDLNDDEADDDADGPRDRFRPEPPRPCFMLLDDYLIVADRPAALKQAILAHQGESPRLATQLDYKLIVSRIERQYREFAPSMIQFQRPEEGMKLLYEMATNEENRQLLGEFGEDNRFAGSVHKSLEENPLPPFEVIAKYLAPGGAAVVDDGSGIHYMAFTLRRKNEEEKK